MQNNLNSQRQKATPEPAAAQETKKRPTMTLDDIVARTSDLPALSTTSLEVMRAIDSPNSTAGDVADLLSRDQSLSIRVLRLANSSYYGIDRKVTNLTQAVIILGMRSVKDLALVAATYPWMGKAGNGSELEMKHTWSCSMSTALAAKTVAKMSGHCDRQLAFTAGLVHDMGKVALSVWMEEKLKAIVAYAEREGMTLEDAERKILGYDHCQLGAKLARNWNLPELLVNTIRHYSSPDDSRKYHPVVDCVHLGAYLTMGFGPAFTGDGLYYRVSEKCFQRLGLTSDDIEKLSEEFMQTYAKHEAMFKDVAA